MDEQEPNAANANNGTEEEEVIEEEIVEEEILEEEIEFVDEEDYGREEVLAADDEEEVTVEGGGEVLQEIPPRVSTAATAETVSITTSDDDQDGAGEKKKKKKSKKDKKHRKKGRKSSSSEGELEDGGEQEKKKKRGRRKRKKEQPDGFHGQDINMDEIKEQYRIRQGGAGTFSCDCGKAPQGFRSIMWKFPSLPFDFPSFLWMLETTIDPEKDHDDDLDRSVHSKSSLSSMMHSRRSTIAINPFLHDDPREMTFSRRIALYLMTKKWYNPSYDPNEDNTNPTKNGREKDTVEFDDDLTEEDDGDVLAGYEKPSLAKAWAYFEHSTLQRYVVNPMDETDGHRNFFQRLYDGYINTNRVLTRAEPGTTSHKTRLYDPISTPHKQVSY